LGKTMEQQEQEPRCADCVRICTATW
jgi:hypothetical protein